MLWQYYSNKFRIYIERNVRLNIIEFVVITPLRNDRSKTLERLNFSKEFVHALRSF